jgi:hypothetical protein
MNRICGKCHLELDVSSFQFKNKKLGIRQSVCTKCGREYRKKHYAENVEYYVKKARKRNKKIVHENQQKILNYLLQHPCIDCGESDPVVLTFDHVRDSLLSNVSQIVNRAANWDVIEKEIAKCDVRCANCHMRKTAKQFNYKNRIKSS